MTGNLTDSNVGQVPNLPFSGLCCGRLRTCPTNFLNPGAAAPAPGKGDGRNLPWNWSAQRTLQSHFARHSRACGNLLPDNSNLRSTAMKPQHQIKQAAFTLVELLVVIS